MVPPVAPAAKRSGLDVTRPNGAASLTVDAEDATERGVDGSATDVEGIVAFAAERPTPPTSPPAVPPRDVLVPAPPEPAPTVILRRGRSEARELGSLRQKTSDGLTSSRTTSSGLGSVSRATPTR